MIATIEPPVPARAKAHASVDPVAELQKTISASRLSLWLQCRLKFYFRYVERIQKPPTPSMHCGSTVHAVLQQWNMARWKREPFALERFKVAFGVQWTGLQKGIAIKWDGEEEDKRASSWRALEHYFGETPVKADEKPEAVEVGVEADLSKNGLPTLIGFIDLIRAGGRIVDFKLVGKSPDPIQILHVHELQLTCYSVLYRDATGRSEAGLELHHLVRTKTPKLIVTSLPPATEQQKTRLFRQIESYQSGLEHRDFVPSPGFGCHGCEYFAECRSWKGGK